MRMKQNHSKEAEEAVLGAILIDESILNDIRGLVRPSDFYYDVNGKIYTAIIELNDSAIPIDTVTLIKYLQENDNLEKVGGAYKITGLRDSCPTTANSVVYAKSIRNYAKERQIKKIGYRIGKGDEKASTELLELLKSEPTYKEFSQSDSGNADLLVHLYGDRIRFNHTERMWLIWNDHYWQPDEENRVNELAKKSSKYRQQQALTINDTTKKMKEVNFAIKSEDQHKIVATLNSAKTIAQVSTIANNWNTDPLSLQCDNGLLLLNGKVDFILGKPQFMISKSTRIKYDKNEKCPLWEKAISEIFSSDGAMVEYFQRCVGYTLSGLTNEQKFFLLHGTGANGKSVIFEIFKDLLGDYAQNTRFDTFERRYNKQSNEIARLQHSRLVTANESGDTKKLDCELLKEVTGGDRVTARKLYHESFDFSPQFKLWLASNSLPAVNDTSLGFWRRVQIIKLREKFLGDSADLDLVNKLKAEIQGILNWALDGFERYADIGLDPPKKVENAVEEYKVDSDIVLQFVSEFVVPHKGNIIPAKHLYECFLEWYIENYTDMPITQIRFGKKMREMGFKDVKISGVKKWMDLEIIKD